MIFVFVFCFFSPFRKSFCFFLYSLSSSSSPTPTLLFTCLPILFRVQAATQASFGKEARLLQYREPGGVGPLIVLLGTLAFLTFTLYIPQHFDTDKRETRNTAQRVDPGKQTTHNFQLLSSLQELAYATAIICKAKV